MKIIKILVVTGVIAILGTGIYGYFIFKNKDDIEKGIQSFISGRIDGKSKFILAEYYFSKAILKKDWFVTDSITFIEYGTTLYYGIKIPEKGWVWNPEIKNGILSLSVPKPILIESKVKKLDQQILRNSIFIEESELIRDIDITFEEQVHNAGKELEKDSEIIRICRIKFIEFIYELLEQMKYQEIKEVIVNFV